MKRSNFLKGLLALPFAVKAVTKEKGLPKDKDGLYVDKKDFEKEVRAREMKSNFSGITISYPNNINVSSWTPEMGTAYGIGYYGDDTNVFKYTGGYRGITGSIHIDDIKDFNERISGYHNSKL